MNRYYNPVQTVEGPGCAGELAALLREMALEEGRVLLLVWNEDVLKLPTFMELADAGFMVCSLVKSLVINASAICDHRNLSTRTGSTFSCN